MNIIVGTTHWLRYTECYRKSFTTLKEYTNFTEDIHSVSNCHNVAKHCKFDARNSVRPLLLHGDEHYQYRISGHAPTVPHSTIRR
jgi:hypothetical protein